MVAVRNRRVATAFTVNMARFMAAAGMIGSAAGGIDRADLQHVLVDVAVVRRVHVPVVQIVDVPVMENCGVTAARSMDVVVIFVDGMAHVLVVPFGLAGDSLAWASALNTRSTMCWSASA